jgi:hypothetical protein
MVVISGFSVTALAMPASCPAGTHKTSASTCLSDGEHPAPSSGIMIPNYVTGPDSRNVLRGEIALGGLLVAGALLFAARKPSRRPSPPAVA